MTDRSTTHATFALERTFPSPPARVFAAWADAETKRRWFAGGDAEHELDFRVGGREVNHGLHDGAHLRFESYYRDIVTDERIVYTSVLSRDGRPATISLTTVELHAVGGGTRLTLTEQGTFLDGFERPGWREEGTGAWLDALGTELDALGTDLDAAGPKLDAAGTGLDTAGTGLSGDPGGASGERSVPT